MARFASDSPRYCFLFLFLFLARPPLLPVVVNVEKNYRFLSEELFAANDATTCAIPTLTTYARRSQNYLHKRVAKSLVAARRVKKKCLWIICTGAITSCSHQLQYAGHQILKFIHKEREEGRVAVARDRRIHSERIVQMYLLLDFFIKSRIFFFSIF